ncbi:TetR/AcrR family transcriptional regulator [Planobispora longispora]|uniref:TetR family transcriptional regulator n=1 Tax=Planobispora longispora TaxID=28887 RepID=A0A8J3RFB1_9ACTN|nr:TetR/AcrR family transcriptional regulator [Planobispora longispora]GIH74677.1 TetR family transcriptional regulator [Planobispora longispora]
MAVSARRGEPLTLEEICATALRMIDAGGVDSLSMRKLAAELDVNPMSLYHHVDSKTALLQQVCSMVALRLRLPADDGTPWRDQLRALGYAYRSIAQRHPSLWLYVQSHPEALKHDYLLWDVLNRILVAAGVPPERLAHTRKALFTFVSGFVFAECAGILAEQDGPGGAADVDDTFEVAVDLIIAGLSAARP